LRRRLSWTAVCSTLSLGVPAFADYPQAEALFRAGREAARRNQHREACEKFRESERLQPALGTELNLALCEEQLGNLSRALELFEHVIERLPEGDERGPIAAERARALRARIPRLVLTAREPLPSDTTVTIDGVELARVRLGSVLPIDPGSRTVEVRAPSRIVRRYALRLMEGVTTTLELELGPELVQVERIGRQGSLAASHSRRAPESNKTWGILTLGVGASALSVSLVTGLGVLREKEAFDQECDASGACSDSGLKAAERGQTLALISTVSGIAALACGATGAWILLGGSEGKREREPSAARVSLMLGPRGLVMRSQY
jgi:hypothetical protein